MDLGHSTMTDVDLHYLPAEPSQIGAQRCYLRPEYYQGLDLLLGQWITVRCEKFVWVCTSWPCTDLPENCIQFDKSVSVQGHNNTDCITSHCLQNIDKVRLLQSVTVTVLVEPGQLVDDKLKKSALENYLQRMLVGTGVVKKCKISWPGVYRTRDLPQISSLIVEDCLVKLDSTTTQHDSKLNTSCIKHVGIITPKTVLKINEIATEDAAQNLTHGAEIKIAGLDDAVILLEKLITRPVEFPKSFEALNLSQSKGILIHGPTGVGKTSLVHYVTARCNAFLTQITGTDVFGSSPGETEHNLRAEFEKAKLIAKCGKRCVVILLDELDVLCPKRGISGGTHESRIVAQLLLLMDEMRECQRVVVIGATNRPSVIDPALRRPGRFDQEVIIGMPNAEQRCSILQTHVSSLSIGADVIFTMLARSTNGFSGADLACLCREAVFEALSSSSDLTFESGEKPELSMSDFTTALNRIIPSLQRSASCITELEPVPWTSIGGLAEIKQKLQQAVQWPLDHWQSFSRLGIYGPSGVLLYGPPGCCKTTLARASASSATLAFFSVNCAQLYSPFVGDSEKIIADLFQKARMSAPTVIFLDELDSIVGERSSENHGSLSDRILSALLNEMDGIGTSTAERIQESAASMEFAPRPKVIVMAATNRVELVDAALLRPGRFDHLIYVPPPDQQGRLDILKVHTWNIPLGEDVDLDHLVTETDNYTGADLEALCREAALLALHQDGLDTKTVHHRHFVGALQMCKASLDENLLQRYKKS